MFPIFLEVFATKTKENSSKYIFYIYLTEYNHNFVLDKLDVNTKLSVKETNIIKDEE